MVEEVRQRWQAGKASLYFRTTANKLDAVIMLIFTVAFLCRVAELLSDTARQPGTAANAIGRAHIGHTVGHAMLCINVILCAIRLLYMIAALSPRLAILIIMARRMICEDVAPFLVFSAFVVLSFEVAAHHFSHTMGVTHRFFSFLDQLIATGELDGIHVRGPLYHDLPEWDVPALQWRLWLGLFQAVYVVVAVIVLMNLLIAMMSNTFGRIIAQSSAEWRLLFAELVQEYTETPLLPPPLSPLQYVVSAALRLLLRQGYVRRAESATSHTTSSLLNLAFTWGRHVSPITRFQVAFQMDVAAASAHKRQFRANSS